MINTNVIHVVLTVLGLLCLGVGALVGFLRGFFKAAMRLIAIAAAALLSLPLTVIVTTVMGENAVALGTTILAAFGMDLGSESPNLAAASGNLLSAVSSVFVYFIIVIILLLVFLIVLSCLRKLFGRAEQKMKVQPVASHGFGFLVGLLAGFLLFAVLTLPVIGVAHTTEDTVATLQQAQACPIDVDTLQTLTDSAQSVTSSPLCRLAWAVPQKALYRKITTVKTDRGNSVLDEELHAAALIADDVFVLIDGSETSFGKKQADAVTHIAASLGDTKMLPSLLAGFLSDVSTKWLADDTYFGLSAPYVKGPAAVVVKAAYLLFSTTNVETIEKDLMTVADMLASLEEAGLLDTVLDEETILDKLSDGSFFDQFSADGDDERSQILNDSVLEAAIQTLAEKIGYTGSLEDARAQLEIYADKVADLLADTANMAQSDREPYLAGEVSSLAAELGFQISADNAQAVVEQLLDRYGNEAPTDISLTDFLSVLAAAFSSFINA